MSIIILSAPTWLLIRWVKEKTSSVDRLAAAPPTVSHHVNKKVVEMSAYCVLEKEQKHL